MLGTSSLAMAIVMSVVTLGGLFGVIREPWTERHVVLVEKQPRQVISRQDPATGQYTSEVVYVDAGYIGMPTGNTVLLGWLSLILGGIGLALSVRERRVSWLCAAGFAMTLAMMALGMAPVRFFSTTLNTARTSQISAFQLGQQFGSFGLGSGLSHDLASVHRLTLAFGRACRPIR